MSFFLSLNRMKIVRILLFYYWISPLSANTFLAANTAFNTFGNPVYGTHCKNVSITFSGDIPVFDTLKKIKLLHPLIYKRCSSLSPSFNI